MSHTSKSTFSVIFGQLELLQDMAIRAGDTDLAADLNVALTKALFRHFDGMIGIPPGRSDTTAA